ncbi:protein LplB [Anaerocolumna cellulosilytica]|uniref:Protein LplB n=1 Tax=Anaerocolumna cellulosilytica TaxID=433286 RepID=A0A6S6R4C9_9FIRM|nr:ABC transporter permease subunit [Anaerocolumna cellulosilytica]MBB5194966.1 putative aldouronate transport system permease protein [Anaerocolumna cellulosilytica]BCJ96199.1 protein LplB [Anaerocolumna cellulosilytica]
MGKSLSYSKNKPVSSKKSGGFLKYLKQHKWLYLMLLPGALYFLIFRYMPMGGIIIAFQKYSPFLGIKGSPFVGLTHFKNFFTGADFWMLLRNTLSISLLSLVFYFPAPIILALLLNEIKHQNYKRTIQTFIYIPHFISWVIIASLTYQLFNINDGIVNMIIKQISGDTINILGSPSYFRGLIIGQSIWKETGYGTIIFLAALSGVDMELYEAARVDGANRWRLMWHITLPAIKATIIIMLILRVGSILNTGYEQIFLMRNSLNMSTAEVFDTYIYQKGITNAQYSYSTAAGLFKSVVGMIMVLGSNKIAKKAGESGIY